MKLEERRGGSEGERRLRLLLLPPPPPPLPASADRRGAALSIAAAASRTSPPPRGRFARPPFDRGQLPKGNGEAVGVKGGSEWASKGPLPARWQGAAWPAQGTLRRRGRQLCNPQAGGSGRAAGQRLPSPRVAPAAGGATCPPPPLPGGLLLRLRKGRSGSGAPKRPAFEGYTAHLCFSRSRQQSQQTSPQQRLCGAGCLRAQLCGGSRTRTQDSQLYAVLHCAGRLSAQTGCTALGHPFFTKYKHSGLNLNGHF